MNWRRPAERVHMAGEQDYLHMCATRRTGPQAPVVQPGARPASACNSIAHTHTAHEEKRKAQEGVMRVLETVGGLRFAQPDCPGHGWVYWKPPRMGTSRQIKDIRGRGRELCLRALFPHAHSAEREQAKHKHRLGARGLLCRGSAMQCGPGSFVSAGTAQEHFPTSEYSCAVPCRAVHADRALSKSDMAHAVNKIESDLARSSAH